MDFKVVSGWWSLWAPGPSESQSFSVLYSMRLVSPRIKGQKQEPEVEILRAREGKGRGAGILRNSRDGISKTPELSKCLAESQRVRTAAGSRTTPVCEDITAFLEMRNRTCNECPHRLIKDGTLGRTWAVRAEETCHEGSEMRQRKSPKNVTLVL